MWRLSGNGALRGGRAGTIIGPSPSTVLFGRPALGIATRSPQHLTPRFNSSCAVTTAIRFDKFDYRSMSSICLTTPSRNTKSHSRLQHTWTYAYAKDNQDGGAANSGASGGSNSAANGNGDDDDDDDDDVKESEVLNAETPETVPSELPAYDEHDEQLFPLLNMLKESSIPPKVLVYPVLRNSILPATYGFAYMRDQQFLRHMEEMTREQPYAFIGLFLVKQQDDFKSDSKVTNLDQIYPVGILGVVTVVDVKRGAVQFLASSRRIKVTGIDPDAKRLTALVEPLKDQPYSLDDPELKAHQADLESLTSTLQMSDLLQHCWNYYDPRDPGEAADLFASLAMHMSIPPENEEQQQIIQETDIKERLRKTVMLIKRQFSISSVSNKIKEEADAKLEERSRQVMQREELRAIRLELGLDKPQTETLMVKFKERLKDLKIPPHAQKVIDEEMAKLTDMSSSSSEYSVVRTYLDWLTTLPWGVQTTDNLDIKHATDVLDREHYGMQDVKDRILEFIAVSSLQGEVQGKIILLVGPPGVGKTSIGKSIATALQREFFRFSVGGIHDEAEIKGHRRTYIGAMPGKMLQALKRVKTSNPVILIDEVDKMGAGHKGDPSSALLEVLDPKQNDKFLDHYLDVTFDMSKVLFMCTANSTETIPRPLLDRMEVIRLSGYVEDEKVQIAEKYLIPRAIEETGLADKHVEMERTATQKLIRSYCREAGVRNLQQHVEKVMRKVAHKLVVEHEGVEPKIAEAIPAPVEEVTPKEEVKKEEVKTDEGAPVPKETVSEKPAPPKINVSDASAAYRIVKSSNLEEFLGKPPFSDETYYATTPAGIVMGLAWTSMGGSTPYIETVLDKHHYLSVQEKRRKQIQKAQKEGKSQPPKVTDSGRLVKTGQLGDVMKESAHIAYTYAKIYYAYKGKSFSQVSHLTGEREYNPDFFSDAIIHLHLPEGATPKDGPSAGIGMVTSLLSLAFDKPLRQNLAMTGEVTLTGKVLPVGGIKEKVIAARRSKVTCLVLPKANEKDWKELPEFMREGINVHFADYYDDVFKVVFDIKDDEWEQLSALVKQAKEEATHKQLAYLSNDERLVDSEVSDTTIETPVKKPRAKAAKAPKAKAAKAPKAKAAKAPKAKAAKAPRAKTAKAKKD